jgi:hypothetical protein
VGSLIVLLIKVLVLVIRVLFLFDLLLSSFLIMIFMFLMGFLSKLLNSISDQELLLLFYPLILCFYGQLTVLAIFSLSLLNLFSSSLNIISLMKKISHLQVIMMLKDELLDSSSSSFYIMVKDILSTL